MKTYKMTLIQDDHNRIGWLGAKSEQPDQQWLDGQSIPFHKDANFYTAYPLSGGSVIIDRDRIEILGEFNGSASAGEPRHSVLVALWYALDDAGEAYSVPEYFNEYYRPDGAISETENTQ